MSNLRNKLIRLAHQNPELRKDLLPLLKESAQMVFQYDIAGYFNSVEAYLAAEDVLFSKRLIMNNTNWNDSGSETGSFDYAVEPKNVRKVEQIIKKMGGTITDKIARDKSGNQMMSRYASDDTPEEWFDAFNVWWGGIRKGLLADDEKEVRDSLGWDLYQICVGWDQSSKSRKSDAQKAIANFSARFMKEIDALNKKADDIKK